MALASGILLASRSVEVEPTNTADPETVSLTTDLTEDPLPPELPPWRPLSLSSASAL